VGVNAGVAVRGAVPVIGTSRVVRMVVPSGSGVAPASTNSKRPVCLMVFTACSRLVTPGSSTTMRRVPAIWTTGSLTPRAFTRFSMMRRVSSRFPRSTG